MSKKRGRPFTKDLIPMEKVPALITRLTGVSRTRATVYLWARKGRPDAHGQIAKLKTYRRLGQLYTTEEAVKEFIMSL